MEFVRHMSAGVESVYLVGGAMTTMSELPGLIAAINYIKDKGISITVGTYSTNGDGIKVPIALRCDRPSMQSSVKKTVSEVLDNCTIQWRTIEPRASSPESIKVATKVDAADGGRHITVEDIVPTEIKADPFAGLVGMDAPIECARRLAMTWKAFGKDSVESASMVLMGNPGTGKTRFATCLCEYLKSEGLIHGGFHKVSAPELIGQYVGETPQRMKRAFVAASDGVLFIDEAYSLVDCQGGYGQEAIDTLVECMESLRDKTIVVAAGYPEHMRRFLAANPGLRSRFGFLIQFPEYSPSDLLKIYKSFASSKHFPLDSFDEELLLQCERLPEFEGYAAARTVRRIFDESVIAAAERHPRKRLITQEDFQVAISRIAHQQAPERAVGFS